ncbi:MULTISPECIES: hypothetical protein [unclassified Streptomyces]|uniref:hypothetical protein n=1 Tax=unclassified Streptomyces TaxID=2593676 RepID=UPI002E80ADA7|nr:hypothetical protein [Streptomyces sp. NBC_00589]WTI34703.1 hypothetical protein OIC96_06710 [Streptomyces sp. NBC_00775]WUB31624.1 hypothetical protein OHA51_43020 [Streptomyces sp. NBC_00589]
MSSESPARAMSFPPDNDGWTMAPAPYGSLAGEPGPEWVALPAEFTATRWADSSAYAKDIATALVIRQRELLGDRNIADDLHTRVADQIRDSYAQLFDLVPAHFHLLYWPDLRKPPVPVFVGFWQPEHDAGSAALHYSGSVEYEEATGETPIREGFTTDRLGDGVRVLRLVPLKPDDPRDPDFVLGVLAYHWRTRDPAVDVQLLAFTNELGQLYAALPDLDAFARSLVLTDEPVG